MKVKICGITNFDDAVMAASLGADALGFIFYDKSQRYIAFDTAAQIISLLPDEILKVGVFVSTDINVINESAERIGLTNIQLHGNETQNMIDAVKLPVWKALRVNEGFDFNFLDNFTNCSIMLDAYSENEFGGTGKSFYWDKIPTTIRNKIILAGGISLDNIEYIYRNISPAWIDVSSSTEICPGKKDEIKLKEFFDKINKLRTS